MALGLLLHIHIGITVLDVVDAFLDLVFRVNCHYFFFPSFIPKIGGREAFGVAGPTGAAIMGGLGTDGMVGMAGLGAGVAADLGIVGMVGAAGLAGATGAAEATGGVGGVAAGGIAMPGAGLAVLARPGEVTPFFLTFFGRPEVGVPENSLMEGRLMDFAICADAEPGLALAVPAFTPSAILAATTWSFDFPGMSSP
jgi:hypothetical protein